MKNIFLKVITLALIMVFAFERSNAQTPDQLFQKGIMKEEGEGSLKEAIELYKSVADNTKADKVLRAKALYQMGNCYEKLGQQEARNVYEKLVANYTDPQELVANAKRKLNKLNIEQSPAVNSGITIRQITDTNQDESAFSPDGKYVLSYNWDEVSLYVKDKKAGKSWRVSPIGVFGFNNNGVNESHYPNDLMWSTDSRYIAYTWYSEISHDGKNKFSSELHIVGVDGKDDRIVRTDTVVACPTDWSSDRKKMLMIVHENPETVKLFMISTDTGTEKILLNTGKKWLGKANFTNDEKFIVFDVREDAITDNWDIYSIPVDGGEMQKLISYPEYDANPHSTPGTNQFVFLSKHSGSKDLWSMEIENGKRIGEPKIMKSGLEENISLNGVLNDGTALFSTRRVNPDFYYAKLDFVKNDVVLHPFNIARNSIGTMVKTIWYPSLTKVAALVADPFISQGVIQIKMIGYNLKTGEKTEIPSELRTFPLQDWIEPQWTPDEKSVLIKAQTIDFDRKPRGIFKFDFSTGQVEEYMTKEQAWTGLHWKWLQFSPDGKTHYFASLDSNFNYPVRIIERSVETGEEKVITQFDKEIKTFCLSPDGKSIAVKYENALQIISVDNPSEIKKIEGLDKNWGTLLGWTSDSKSVLVQKPADKKSWSIWKQSLDGQEYREVISADKLKPFFGASGLMLHYVGNETYLSMQNGERIYELWAVDNIVQK